MNAGATRYRASPLRASTLNAEAPTASNNHEYLCSCKDNRRTYVLPAWVKKYKIWVCMYVCTYEGPLTTVSTEGEGASFERNRERQAFDPHLPNPVSINHSQHTTNIRTLRRDWFYSRPMEAAETTMWVYLVPAWAIHNSTWGSRPVHTKLSLLDFCDRT